jgi:hypothetical protein
MLGPGNTNKHIILPAGDNVSQGRYDGKVFQRNKLSPYWIYVGIIAGCSLSVEKMSHLLVVNNASEAYRGEEVVWQKLYQIQYKIYERPRRDHCPGGFRPD